jgi:hypothetical protein
MNSSVSRILMGRHGDRVVHRAWACRNNLLQFDLRLADRATGATGAATCPAFRPIAGDAAKQIH